MSYFTHVDFQFSDEPPAMKSLLDRARSYLSERDIFAVDDVLKDIQCGFENGNCDFSDLMCEDIQGLMENISAAFPSIVFYVRGMGEEYGDVWLRKFEGGKTVSSTGPFEDQ